MKKYISRLFWIVIFGLCQIITSTAQSDNINAVSTNLVLYNTNIGTLNTQNVCELIPNSELSSKVASVLAEIKDFNRHDDLGIDIKRSQSFLDLINITPAIIKIWNKLAIAGRRELRKEKAALEAFRDLINDNKTKELLANNTELEGIMAKMESFKIGDDATDFAKICNDVRKMINDALPADVSKIKNIATFLGNSGFTNASEYTRRHADLMVQKITQNGAFIKNADNFTFEFKEIVENAPNAVADFDFVVDGIRYVGEIKAGDNVITSNFTSQMINYFGRVNDLRNVKSFRRVGVPLSKTAVVDHWKANFAMKNQKVIDLVNKYKIEELKIPGTLDEFTIEDFLRNNDDWFNVIFNSNFS